MKLLWIFASLLPRGSVAFVVPSTTTKAPARIVGSSTCRQAAVVPPVLQERLGPPCRFVYRAIAAQNRRMVPRFLRRALALFVTFFPARAFAALVVDRSVVDAAEAARMAARPGSLKDRIISDHVELITSALLEKQRAQVTAMRNMVIGIVIVASVFGVFATISTSRAERRLREQEMEIFGEFRDGSTEMIEEEEDDLPPDDGEEERPPPDEGDAPPKKKKPSPPPPKDDP